MNLAQGLATAVDLKTKLISLSHPPKPLPFITV